MASPNFPQQGQRLYCAFGGVGCSPVSPFSPSSFAWASQATVFEIRFLDHRLQSVRPR